MPGKLIYHVFEYDHRPSVDTENQEARRAETNQPARAQAPEILTVEDWVFVRETVEEPPPLGVVYVIQRCMSEECDGRKEYQQKRPLERITSPSSSAHSRAFASERSEPHPAPTRYRIMWIAKATYKPAAGVGGQIIRIGRKWQHMRADTYDSWDEVLRIMNIKQTAHRIELYQVP